MYKRQGYDRTSPNPAIVEDPRTDADQGLIFHHATVDCGIVANCHPVADRHRIKIPLTVQDGAVLNVAALANPDGVNIAAQNSVHPHRGSLAEDDISNNLCADIDIATGVDLGRMVLVAANHGCDLP